MGVASSFYSTRWNGSKATGQQPKGPRLFWQSSWAMQANAATTQETLEWVLAKSKRVKGVPIHSSFLQQRVGGRARPSSLAKFVSARRERALDLYMLALALASSHPYNVAQPAGVWSRALGIGSARTAAESISKQWRWLEDQQLIRREGRRGRWAEIVFLREDGSGSDYVRNQAGGNWFWVPFAFWRSNWHGRLDLPAKAVLLIGLSLLDDFYLPEEKGPDWYGISADTIGRGLRTLEREKLLTQRTLTKPAPGSPHGYTRQSHYTLQAPFGPKGKRSHGLRRATPAAKADTHKRGHR